MYSAEMGDVDRPGILKPTLLYITYSSHSGSTLLAFLLNDHPDIVSLGHMTGWRNAPEGFRCSCGQALRGCPFFRRVADAFRKAGLEFEFSNFGTAYRVTRHDRLNRYLLGALPYVHSPLLERMRDALVGHIPRFAATLAEQDRRNMLLISTALSYKGARVAVDKSTSENRIHHLRRLDGVELAVIHLVQDPRGVVLTDRERRNWEPVLATRMWLRKNARIIESTSRASPVTTVYYEDLVDRTNDVLGEIHQFLGLRQQAFDGNFKKSEHHILGNSMRFGEPVIRKDARWRTMLSTHDIDAIEGTLCRFVRTHGRHQLSKIVVTYLEGAKGG